MSSCDYNRQAAGMSSRALEQGEGRNPGKQSATAMLRMAVADCFPGFRKRSGGDG